jgi:hydrogenase/urease accessory protein HupE
MILPEWFTPVLIGIDVLIIIYGLQIAYKKKMMYGWFLALAFFLFGIKEILPYNNVNLPFAFEAILSVAGLAAALWAFYLLFKSLPS